MLTSQEGEVCVVIDVSSVGAFDELTLEPGLIISVLIIVRVSSRFKDELSDASDRGGIGKSSVELSSISACCVSLD